jgi:transcriptional regulator with XRE-family HTH domain
MGRNTRSYSTTTRQALKLFATQVKIARKKHRWSEAELAERAGTTRPTIRKVEQGSPTTEIGLYFEIAGLLGIPLFTTDSTQMTGIQNTLDLQLSLLPKRINTDSGEVFDDF